MRRLGMTRSRAFRAFTLIELMIVIAVISLLAAIALPAYYRMIIQVHRVEAQGLLFSLQALENTFQGETGRFGCLNEVGFQMEGNGHFSIWVCDSLAGCTGDPDADGVVECGCVQYPYDWTSPGILGGGEALTPPDVPADCSALWTQPRFEANAENWCSRPSPEVVNFYWIFSGQDETTGEVYSRKDIYEWIYEEDPPSGC